MKAAKYLNKLTEKRTRNALAIIAMFACTSICFGDPPTITIDSDRGDVNVAGNSVDPNGTGPFSLDPNNCTLIIKKGARIGQASGAYINDDSGFAVGSTMTGNKLIVHGGNFNDKNIHGACSLVSTDVNVNGNTVEINAGNDIRSVFGGYTLRGTASGNKAFINNKVTIGENVYGGYVLGNGNANNNRVTITDANVGRAGRTDDSGDVYGGCVHKNGNANNNEVTITNATVKRNVFGGRVAGNGNGNGNANNNEVIITGATVGRAGTDDSGNVYGGYVDGNGNAKNNKVTIDGGRVERDVYGGFVFGDAHGNATGNTITIIRTPKFGDYTILCGGFCAKDEFDKFTGNTLIIKETRGIRVKGISNFENYEFYLSEDIKPQEPVLIARNGGCSWDKDRGDYSDPCSVKLSKTNITIYSGVMKKGTEYTLIRSPQGFDGISKSKSIGPVVYKWDLEIVDSKDLPTSSSNSSRGSESESSSSSSSSSYSSSSSSYSSSSSSSSSSGSGYRSGYRSSKDLIATLTQKSITPSAVALCKGHGTAILLVNDGLDCILKTMEESEGLPDKRKNHIEAFAGTSLCSLNYNTDKTNPQETKTNSVVAGAKVTLELGGKDLTTAIFGEYGTGTSKMECYKDSSNAKSSCMGGGLFAKYDLYKDESVGQEMYGELVLTAGQTRNDFDGTINNAEVKYKDSKNIYEGFELGIGHKHKINKDIKLEENLRYMVTHGNKKDQELIKQRTIEFDSVMSNRIKIGAKGTYTGMVLKPYLGLWYEQEFGGKVKAAIQDGLDKLGGVSSTTSKGLTAIAELGASVKVWKLDLDLSGQGCIGKRNGFAGTLRIKYTF